jgi:hypothetical protein
MMANISFSYTSSKALSVDGFCFVLPLWKFAQAALMEEAIYSKKFIPREREKKQPIHILLSFGVSGM